MARVIFARFCREVKRDEQRGLYSLVGEFSRLRWINAPVGFVCVMYWQGHHETFRQSFALLDETGNTLDELPATDCVLSGKPMQLSSAFFYARFPQAGQFMVNVYQNGLCTATIPLPVLESPPLEVDVLTRLSPLGSVAKS